MIVLDASAVLALLQGEPGAPRVEEALEEGVIGAANWSEVSQKVLSRGADWGQARELLLSYGLRVEPVTEADAELAASLWRPGAGLSLGDRLCLALGRRLGCSTLTADRAWGSTARVEQLRD
ncbi:PIN domain nuclease, a component of toxin-antitoxin system (PIN domain) [Tessaracoccus bendigoensis DSM 12906]|uniref:PIN domain nuclease, a component of toxin-antitoxin system (PIN domain) n=1 Tax=Tessaracoccus bendigoensis DSM 12906 TaxID=1123357 RepID=A0A1M6CPA6_9ACTN|nr:type II toxin-antitoxin system VapC family toxin [Tessaracoccus bendigoensis]SHI62733.1 PIN domain nuclease, a component of toxin-antitoxin system (PIN domain) [Tessaracoccus bendigoensis DSM 12906]